MAQASCVLVFGLPLPLRVEICGSTDIEYSSRTGAWWGGSLVCRGFSDCLRAEVCVCMDVFLEDTSGGFIRAHTSR